MDAAADLALYVRLISGMVLGLAVGKLFTGAARFVQHPHDYRINVLHLLWMVFIFGSISVFWWGEAQTFGTVQWTYPLYLFQIAYCASYLFMTAVILPDELRPEDGCATHYDYFIARRHWFFGALTVSHLLDLANIGIKYGWEELAVSVQFLVVNGVVFTLLALGMFVPRRAVQVGVAAIMVALTILTMFLE